MKQNIIHICLILFIILISIQSIYAQGNLSGSFETNSIYYVKDSKPGIVAPDDKFGSDNYFKLDYRYRKFSAGVQYEAYLPVLQGLPSTLRNSGLVFKYASFRDSNFSVTAGDFYEQFGNGLIFRAYEERAIGLNTAVEGVRLAYSFRNLIHVKGIAGRSREFMDKAASNIKAAGLSVDIASLLKLENSTADAAVNMINRYVSYAGQEPINLNVQAYSFNINWNVHALSLQGEYAYKSKDNSVYTNNRNKDGSALLLEIGYNTPGFGSLLTLRRLEYMQFGTTRGITGIGRDLNYLPALTKQHSYSLAVLNPHNTMGNGETGGQLDIQYNLPQGSVTGGKYGMQLSLNASTYYNLQGDVINGYDFFATGKTKYYQDINLDIEKRFSTSMLAHLFYANQQFNPVIIGKESSLYKSHIVAGDLRWQPTAKNSFRFELQHLWSGDYLKNWAAALIEFSAAPSFTCFIGDMHNYGDSNIHYYRLGSSYTFSRTRIALNYGRNREGLICAGGVCLYMPAYTGFNLSIASSF
ncbi:MAG: hypothetical protein J0I84_08835 [Terrimonas sp.]|nr:hypothetical protein [Terrimonas sp.]OJY91672.1 MAG: hypothetical protein BGP13_07715 [Sphingobacteriales bacterium 40-81]